MIVVDGSAGEGGGQILRTSLALSMVTGQSFRIEGIRAGRQKPGLLRQHLTAALAAIEVAQAEADGVALGSKEISFSPRAIRGGSFTFRVGTAGSATLVLQTVLPALLQAPHPSALVLEGGTHNPAAPPYPFLAQAFAPLVSRMGGTLELGLESVGFYPAGGGRFTAGITPCPRLGRLELDDRGAIRQRTIRSLVAEVPTNVAEREIASLLGALGWTHADVDARPETPRPSPGPGNALVLSIACEHITEVFTGFGERGIRAEEVAAKVAAEARAWLDAEVPVGEHLADQLILPMAMGEGGSFRTVAPSMHLLTQIAIVKQFLDVDIRVAAESKNAFRITVGR